MGRALTLVGLLGFPVVTVVVKESAGMRWAIYFAAFYLAACLAAYAVLNVLREVVRGAP